MDAILNHTYSPHLPFDEGCCLKQVQKSNMFPCCQNLTELDLNGFDTSRVKTFDMMFAFCNNLKKIVMFIGSATDTPTPSKASGLPALLQSGALRERNEVRGVCRVLSKRLGGAVL